MRVIRVTVSAPLGFIRPAMYMGNFVESVDFPYFSTVQGILSRMLDRTVYLDELLPLSYTFSYDYRQGKLYDFRKTWKYGRNKEMVSDIVRYLILQNPVLNIYIGYDRELYDELLNQRFPVYFGNPDFLASVSVKVVELKEYYGFENVDVSGSIVIGRERSTVSTFGAYEFDYKSPYKREFRHVGKHLYIPVGVKYRELVNKENIKNAYIDKELEHIVVLFKEHPREVYYGDGE